MEIGDAEKKRLTKILEESLKNLDWEKLNRNFAEHMTFILARRHVWHISPYYHPVYSRMSREQAAQLSEEHRENHYDAEEFYIRAHEIMGWKWRRTRFGVLTA